MNITEEGKKMPMGIAFDKEAEDMIKKVGASKAKKKKQPKPNMQYQDLEMRRETWEEIFEALGSTSIDTFITNLVDNYYPPRKKIPYKFHE